VLVNLIRDPKYEKMKPVCLQAVKNLLKSAEHERYLKQLGANDVIMSANMQAGVAN